MKEELKALFNLSSDQADIIEIEERMHEGAAVRGANLYILIFAIIIASVGLNMDSTAVVIGAMLISPLMGVIMNFAYAVASQDFRRARSSIIKLSIQVGVSIITSTVYFILSPLNSFSGELMARTTPTLWDVLIAFFGGFSAIIALTRKNSVSNVIPGAAIATALMPPLCTAGYCLAQCEWIRAFGALYLFAINAVFICVSGVTGLYIMKVVNIKAIVKNKKQRIFFIVTVIIAIVPSFLFAGFAVQKDQATREFNKFIENEFVFENTEIVKSDLLIKDKRINVFLIGRVIKDDVINSIEKQLPEYNLGGYDLHVVQTNIEGSFSDEELDLIENSEAGEKISQEEARRNKNQLDIMNTSKELKQSVSKEILALHPEVVSAGLAELTNSKDDKEYLIVLRVTERISKKDENSLEKWMKEKFDKDIHVVQVTDSEKTGETK